MDNMYDKRYGKVLFENVWPDGSANEYVQQCRDQIQKPALNMDNKKVSTLFTGGSEKYAIFLHIERLVRSDHRVGTMPPCGQR